MGRPGCGILAPLFVRPVASVCLMNLRFLETFIWVAKLNGFKAAAGKLSLTQAAVSGRIAALENELSQQLFERGSREIRLTPAGRTLLHYAQQLLGIETTMRMALQTPDTLHGRVRLGVVESIVHTWFAPFIASLQTRYPQLEIELTVESTRRLHDLLRRGSMDLLLQTDALIADDIRNRDLGTLAMVWICAADAPIPDQATLGELQAWPMITFPRHSQPHQQLLDAIEGIGLQPGRIHFVSSIAACQRLIEAHCGVAALPLAAVQTQLNDGRYRQVRCDPPLPDLRLAVSWRPVPVSGLAEAVVGLALEEMRRYAEVMPGVRAPLDSTVLQL